MLYPELFALFCDLHQHPEVAFGEHRTTALVAEQLDRAGFEVRTSDEVTGAVALLRNGPGPVVAIRADIDALPIAERTGLPYSSERIRAPGVAPAMHACGHDVHTTALVGAARVLFESRAEWAGTVVLLAQPAEERGEGARRVIASGLLEGVPVPDVVIGQHLGGREEGGIVSRPGAYEAAQRNWRVTARGQGGHAAGPHRVVNPLVFLAQLVLRLQAAVPSTLAPGERVVLVPTTVVGGTGSNIIADRAVATFCARAFSTQALDALDREVVRVAQGLGRAEGLDEVLVERFSEFPLNVNDPAALTRAREFLETEFGAGRYRETEAILGSEDFGEFPAYWGAPSVYWHYDGGVAPGVDDPEAARRGHSPTYAPDPDRAIRDGTRALLAVARGFLGG